MMGAISNHADTNDYTESYKSKPDDRTKALGGDELYLPGWE